MAIGFLLSSWLSWYWGMASPRWVTCSWHPASSQSCETSADSPTVGCREPSPTAREDTCVQEGAEPSLAFTVGYWQEGQD